MFPLAFIAGWLQGHWWGFISRNYVVWPTFFLMNVFIALKGSLFWFYISLGTQSYCWFCHEAAHIPDFMGIKLHKKKKQYEPTHEIMELITLRKLNLQTRMRSNLLALHVWFLVRPFVYFHTLCVRTAKALARLCGCAVSPEPSLFAYTISTLISWAELSLFAYAISTLISWAGSYLP